MFELIWNFNKTYASHTASAIRPQNRGKVYVLDCLTSIRASINIDRSMTPHVQEKMYLHR